MKDVWERVGGLFDCDDIINTSSIFVSLKNLTPLVIIA